MKYKIATPDGPVEVEGRLCFEKFGLKFGIHKEVVEAKWGNHDEYLVTELTTGRTVSVCLSEAQAIHEAQIILNKYGKKKTLATLTEYKKV